MTLASATLMLFLAVAALFDLRERRVPNQLLMVGAVAGLAFAFMQPESGLPINAFLGGVVGLLLFIIPYLLGKLGAADVKLMALVGLYLGPILVIKAALYSMIAGGGVALFYIFFRTKNATEAPTLPYALAIFFGTFLSLY